MTASTVAVLPLNVAPVLGVCSSKPLRVAAEPCACAQIGPHRQLLMERVVSAAVRRFYSHSPQLIELHAFKHGDVLDETHESAHAIVARIPRRSFAQPAWRWVETRVLPLLGDSDGVFAEGLRASRLEFAEAIKRENVSASAFASGADLRCVASYPVESDLASARQLCALYDTIVGTRYRSTVGSCHS